MSKKCRRRNNCRHTDVEHVSNVLGTMESVPHLFLRQSLGAAVYWAAGGCSSSRFTARLRAIGPLAEEL